MDSIINFCNDLHENLNQRVCRCVYTILKPICFLYMLRLQAYISSAKELQLLHSGNKWESPNPNGFGTWRKQTRSSCVCVCVCVCISASVCISVASGNTCTCTHKYTHTHSLTYPHDGPILLSLLVQPKKQKRIVSKPKASPGRINFPRMQKTGA